MEETFMVELTKPELVAILRCVQAALKGYEAISFLSVEQAAAFAEKIAAIEVE